MRTIVFDCEADGMPDPGVCQLALIAIDDGVITAKNYYISVPQMNIYAYKVHGLSVKALERLSGGKTFADFADEIYRDFYWADLYAGHGISGDVNYLRREFERLGRTFPERKRLCTMHVFTGQVEGLTLNNGQPKNPSLLELCDYLQITHEEITARTRQLFGDGSHPHDARYDAVATLMVIERGLYK